jgi:hypothetical protein
VTDTGTFWRDNRAAIEARSGPPKPPPAPRSCPGIYAWCKRRELAAYAAGGRVVEVGTGRRYESRPERLAAVRAGEPLNLPLSELPRWARVNASRWWRAVVSPGDVIELVDDTGEWSAENGL